MRMEIFTKDNGKTIKLMELETISMQMALPITESGKMTNNTGKEQKHGLMELNMKEHILKEKNTEKVCYSLPMEVYTMVIFNIMKYQVKENMFGQIKKLLMANGRKIKCMVKEFFLGETEKDTKDFL